MRYSIILLILTFAFKGITQDHIYNDSIAYSINLDEYIVTAQYAPTHYKEAAHRVQIIDASSIGSKGAVTLDEALRNVSSLRFSRDPILGTFVQMRGIGSSNVAILKDGIPVVGRLNGAIDISQISMHNIERIEIIEGALSNIYGSNAAGGVINIITKSSQLNRWKGELSAQIESVGRKQFDSSFGYSQGKFTLGVHGKYMNFQTEIEDSLRLQEELLLSDGSVRKVKKYPFNPKDQYGFSGYLRYQPEVYTSLILKYDDNKEKVIDYGHIRRKKYNPYSEDRYYHTDRSDVSLNFDTEIKNTIISLTSAYNNYNRIVDYKRFYIEAATYDSLLAKSDTTHFTSLFNKAVASYALSDGLKLNGGVNYSVERGSGERIMDRMSKDSLSAKFSELATYIDMHWTIMDDLLLTSSARLTYHSIYDNKITPSIQAKWAIYPNLLLRVGYAQGYRSPTLKELYIEFIDVNHHIIGNVDLLPETSHDFQASLDYDFGDKCDLSFNAYRTRINKRIDLISYTDAKYKYDNIDTYSVYGFQPKLTVSFDRLSFDSSAMLGYWSTNISNDIVPNYGHTFEFNNTIDYDIPIVDVGLNINHRHIGKRPLYNQVGQDIIIREEAAYELIDISLSRTILQDKINIYFGIRNLLDISTTNITGVSSSSGHESYGRNITGIGRSYFVRCGLKL